jgi:dolichol-phosphate mannosyltransferase
MFYFIYLIIILFNISTILLMLILYIFIIWNDLWTFGDISRKQTGKRQRFKRFLKFNIVCLAGIIIQTLVVNFLFNSLGMNQYIAKLIAIAVATIWNFWVNLKLSWRVTEVK